VDVVGQLKRFARPVREAFRVARLSSDVSTFRTLYPLLVRDARRPGRATVRLRPLGGASFEIRTDSTDAQVIRDTFVGLYHRPAVPVRPDATLILDLGANIGTTAADFAHRFPQAHVVAVELDHESAELCRQNSRAWGGRIEVVEAAVWSESGEISYAVEEGQHWSASVTGSGELSARAVTIDDLLRNRGDEVDYLKVDIEGAERGVIEHPGGWVDRVRVMHVELHDGYADADCITDLERIGFSAFRDPRHWAAVTATREPTLVAPEAAAG
jgi:FkbM family methyltransferase